MKVNDSGMPEETYWESLFDIAAVLDAFELDHRVGDVAELGCGYGTFTLPVARRVSGTVRTFDIEPEMAARTAERAKQRGVSNVAVAVRDVLAEGFGLPDDSCDACLLFNILHCDHRARLLAEAARVVGPHGGVHVIHWRSDIETPRGPALSIRPTPATIVASAAEAGLSAGPVQWLGRWHYGVTLRRGEVQSMR